MALIVCIGLGLAALRSSTYLWVRTLNTLVVTSLFVAILMAWHCVARKKAFWFGFAVLGWGYYFLAFGPWDTWHQTEVGQADTYEEVKPNILTTDIVRFAVKQVTVFPAGTPGVMFPFQSHEYIETNFCSTWIGHLLLTLTIAYGGGWLSILIGDHRAEGATTESAKERGAKTGP